MQLSSLADKSTLSFASRFSVLSTGSLQSFASVGSILSVSSVGSILSLGSAGSILSVGSAGSILSVGSAGSILSVRSSGKILCVDNEPVGPLSGGARVAVGLGSSRVARGRGCAGCRPNDFAMNATDPEPFAPALSRAMWESVERYHGLTYTAPEVRDEATKAGLKGFWMNYFATRIAPVGPVGPEIVESSFFYYAPKRVHRAIPDAWSFATPESILAARYRGMDSALRRHFDVTAAQFGEAADLVREATTACQPIGRLLYAGWAALEWPEQPHLALWHGCTLLREYRSGNHLIALCSEGVDGIESVLTHVAVGEAPADWIRDEAGWSDEAVDAAEARLVERGWFDGSGQATEQCHAVRRRIESHTDALDWPVWSALGEARCSRLRELMAELAESLPPDDQLDWEEVYR